MKVTDLHFLATIHLNLVRVASATLTLLLLFIVGRIIGVLSGPGWSSVPIYKVLVFPAGLLLVGVSLVLFCRVIAPMNIPFAGLISGLMSLVMIVFIAVGDPLIWFVRRYYPSLVPVRDFSFVNPHAVMMVQRQDGEGADQLAEPDVPG